MEKLFNNMEFISGVKLIIGLVLLTLIIKTFINEYKKDKEKAEFRNRKTKKNDIIKRMNKMNKKVLENTYKKGKKL